MVEIRADNNCGPVTEPSMPVRSPGHDNPPVGSGGCRVCLGCEEEARDGCVYRIVCVGSSAVWGVKGIVLWLHRNVFLC